MKLVIVEWVDSHAGRGWLDMSEIEKGAGQLLFCRSVGWLLCENADCITLVPHVAGEKNETIIVSGAGDMTIPKRAIVKIRTLRLGQIRRAGAGPSRR